MTIAVPQISASKDERIACYNQENYHFRKLKARAMAWFVQIAIRRDMDRCINGGLDYDNPLVQFQGHQEIRDQLIDLEEVIRRHHIIDETDLETIGLTLYNFPTLSHFFVAPEKHAFVREVTVREMLDKTDYLKSIVLNSPLTAYLAGNGSAENSEQEAMTLVHNMTPSRLVKEAGLVQDEIGKEKILLVDMSAPVMLLKQQFLKLLDRESRFKQGAYDDWEEYGILPYLDINRWTSRNGQKVKAKTRVELIYANRLHGYGPKKIEETTVPHITKLMDQQGPVFQGLLAGASKEFHCALAWTRQEDKDADPAIADEVLKRWLPRTYPVNFPDLERTARTFPDQREKLQNIIEILRTDTQRHSLVERIRACGHDDDGTGLLRATEELLRKNVEDVHVPDTAELDCALPSCLEASGADTGI